MWHGLHSTHEMDQVDSNNLIQLVQIMRQKKKEARWWWRERGNHPQKGWQAWTTTKHNCSMKHWAISCRTECKSGFENQETCYLRPFQLLLKSKFQLLQKSIRMVGDSRIKQTWELKLQLKMQRLLVWPGRKSPSIWSLRWHEQHLFQTIVLVGRWPIGATN